MKRQLCIVLALVMALSLAACGTGNNTDSTPEPPPSISEPEPSSAPESLSEESESSEEESEEAYSSEDESTVQEESPSAAVQASQPEQPAVSQAAQSQSAADTSASSAAAVESTASKTLVAYFSFPETDGVDTVAGASRVVVNGTMVGNTQYVAQVIQQTAGGDLFRIEAAADHYPGLHEPLVDQAADEKDENARPALSAQVGNMADYDVVYLGFPNWWGDMPMPLYTFLESYDLSGKTIVPFSTHGGSGFSSTISTIARLQPNATVITEGYTVSRNTVGSAGNAVIEWVNGLDL